MATLYLITVKLFRNDCGGCYTIGIATLSDLASMTRASFSTSEKQDKTFASGKSIVTIDQLKGHKKKKALTKPNSGSHVSVEWSPQ